MDDKDNDINTCLIGAISNLNEGRKQLILSLEKDKEFIDNIPNNGFKFFFKNIFDINYKRKYEEVYSNGQIIFKGIIE